MRIIAGFRALCKRFRGGSGRSPAARGKAAQQSLPFAYNETGTNSRKHITRFPMCNSCYSYRASSRCSSGFMRALSNLFAVRSESTDDSTSNNCCSCCSCNNCTCTPCQCDCSCNNCSCDSCTCTPCSCDCSCNTCSCDSCSSCCNSCSCCSGSTGGTDSYYARQYALGRFYSGGFYTGGCGCRSGF